MHLFFKMRHKWTFNVIIPVVFKGAAMDMTRFGQNLVVDKKSVLKHQEAVRKQDTPHQPGLSPSDLTFCCHLASQSIVWCLVYCADSGESSASVVSNYNGPTWAATQHPFQRLKPAKTGFTRQILWGFFSLDRITSGKQEVGMNRAGL